MAGTFITIEGIEGAGKSTVAASLSAWLSGMSIDHCLTREPGGTSLGEQLRSLVLHSTESINPQTELLLFQTARAQLMHEVILPALNEGKTVILDRHTDSTLAYQGYGRGLELDAIRTQNDFATQSRKPDCTLLLDLDAETGLSRARRQSAVSTRPDRFEEETVEFMQRVRSGFLDLAQQEPERFIVVDALQEADQVWKQIQSEIERRNLFVQ